MKITEKREIEHVVGKKCDICGKEINPINVNKEMMEIEWYESGWQGFSAHTGTLDICSVKCFLESIRRIRQWGVRITSMKNYSILTDTINEINE